MPPVHASRRAIPCGRQWQRPAAGRARPRLRLCAARRRGAGVAELEARYMLQADDGGLIAVVNRGLRHGPDAVMRKLIAGEPVDPGAYYFRCTPVFETAAPAYHWLTRTVFVASGARHPDRVEISVYAVR